MGRSRDVGRRRLGVELLALLVFASVGCQSPRVYRRPAPLEAVAAPVAVEWRPAALGEDREAFRLLERRTAGGGSPGQYLLLAAMADRLGRETEGRSEGEGLGHYRDAAAYAWFAAEGFSREGCREGEREAARLLYNRAVERCVRLSGAARRAADPAWPDRLREAGIEAAMVPPSWVGLRFQALWIADDYEVFGLDEVGREGWGVPLVASRELGAKPGAGPDHFHPRRLRMAASAVLRPTGPPEGGAWRLGPVLLELHDPSDEEAIAIGSAPAPLAADLTTPLAVLFLESDLPSVERQGLVDPRRLEAMTGLYLPRPYEPGKIPVVFVHGLASSPLTWLKVMNELQADPELRRRYQFWFAFYSTGYPISYSTMLMRRELQAAREILNPRGDDPAYDRMVIVGHSMGGLMAKLLAQDSGDGLLASVFTRPIDQVAMSPSTRETLEELLVYQPVPSIRRVVFLAAPHRGSHVANRLIGRVVRALIRREGAFYEVHREIVDRNGPGAFRAPLDRRAPSSIDNLEWESPLLKAMEGLGVAPGVPYHSVVGVLSPGPWGPGRLGTDGVVPYQSAHLDGAESELIVNRSHFLTSAPEVIAEVRRILRLHLEESGALGEVQWSGEVVRPGGSADEDGTLGPGPGVEVSPPGGSVVGQEAGVDAAFEVGGGFPVGGVEHEVHAAGVGGVHEAAVGP